MNPRLVYAIGRIPVLGGVLRRLARRYREGSVATIHNGLASGLKWKRYHRFVSGYGLGIYEPEVQEALARNLKPNMVFYDIGANAGFFSLVASRLVSPGGQVFAFEPLPENADVIDEQFRLNDLTNAEVVRAAVGRTTGSARLTVTGEPSTAHLAGPDDIASVDVRLVSLDDFVREHGPPDLVKIDAEGAEADVLEGARRLVAERSPAFLVELHGERQAELVHRFLRERGYEIGDLEGRRLADPLGSRHILAWRPAGGWSADE